MSAAILRIGATDNRLLVSGFQWLHGQEKEIGIESLTAAVLCKRHNEQLSVLDSAATRLFLFLSDTMAGDLTTSIDGKALERWMLKVLCGLVAAGDAGKPRQEPPKEWLEWLFNVSAMSEGTGLSCITPNNPYQSRKDFKHVAIKELPDGTVGGLTLVVYGYAFLFTVVPLPPDPAAVNKPGTIYYHPSSITVSTTSGTRRVAFGWRGGANIQLSRVAPTVAPAPTRTDMHRIVARAKPRIAFTRHTSDPAWRVTEKLVAVLELLLRNRADLYAVSTVRLPNVVGDLEEVDVAFTALGDPGQFFEYVQVRDRHEVEGREWFQQVLGQAKTLGIERATLASSSGFAGTTVRLAEEYGVPLRILQDIPPERIARWYADTSVGVECPTVLIRDCAVTYRSGGVRSQTTLSAAQCREPRVVRLGREAEEPTTLAAVLWREINKEAGRLALVLKGVPEDGQLHETEPVTLDYTSPLDALILPHEGLTEPALIDTLVFRLDAQPQRIRAPITRRLAYVDAVKQVDLAELLVAEGLVAERKLYVCIVRHSCDGKNCQLAGAHFH